MCSVLLRFNRDGVLNSPCKGGRSCGEAGHEEENTSRTSVPVAAGFPLLCERNVHLVFRHIGRHRTLQLGKRAKTLVLR